MKKLTQLLWALGLVCASPTLLASWIEPGDTISLSSTQGLALFVVESDGSLTNIRIDRIGSIFSAPVLKELTSGRELRLLALEQGDYQFDKAQLSIGRMTYQWEMKDLPNRTFHIDAGKLNYIGDLKISGNGRWRQMSVRNGGLRVFDDLETQFVGLRDRFEWRYAGEFPDPFIEFFKHARASHPGAESTSDPEVARPSLQEKDLAALLFREGAIQKEELSPSGRYVLEYRHEGNTTNVYLIDLQGKTNRLLLSSPDAPASAVWLAETLLAINYQRGGLPRVGVYQIRESTQPEFAEIPAVGRIRSTGTTVNGNVIYTRQGGESSGLQLFKITMDNLNQARKLTDKSLGKFPQIGSDLKSDYGWLFDASGVPRLALYQQNSKTRYKYFETAVSSGVDFELDDQENNPNDQFEFAGFDRAGKLLAISNRGRTQTDLVEFDPIHRKEGAVRFTRAGVDVVGVIYGLSEEVVGVRIKSGGRFRQEMFVSAEISLKKALELALPNRSVSFGTRRENGNRLVYSYGPKDPGSYYIFNEDSRKLDLLALTADQLEDRPLLDTRRFEVKSHDNFTIEAFFTAPSAIATGTRPPLLVMPHGGPIGVFDTERFDPEVQFFAQLGFAVVQVNYRGSGGGGTVAANLGIGQYGRAIEDDVDEVVDSLVKAGKVDPDRIVAMGTSYGGYSALMLILDRSKRYKAAVSIAGVTDVLAQFSGGDVTLDKNTAKMLVKIIGDPRLDAVALQHISPVYRYLEFTRPIMLLHDRGDERVTLDQSERLRRLLSLRGTPASTIFVQDNVHGIAETSTAIDVYPKIAAFLFQSLAAQDKAKEAPSLTVPVTK